LQCLRVKGFLKSFFKLLTNARFSLLVFITSLECILVATLAVSIKNFSPFSLLNQSFKKTNKNKLIKKTYKLKIRNSNMKYQVFINMIIHNVIFIQSYIFFKVNKFNSQKIDQDKVNSLKIKDLSEIFKILNL